MRPVDLNDFTQIFENGIIEFADRVIMDGQNPRLATISNQMCEMAIEEAKMLMLLRNTLAQ